MHKGEIATCQGKIGFNSAHEAHRALKRHIGHRQRMAKQKMRVYRCPYCTKFHFGHHGTLSRPRNDSTLGAAQSRHQEG
jgi:hypothetical protein